MLTGSTADGPSDRTRSRFIYPGLPNRTIAMVVKTVVHFEIPAGEVESLSKFYKEVFGWKFSKAPVPDMEYWLISTGPTGKSVPGGMYKKMHAQEGPRNFIA